MGEEIINLLKSNFGINPDTFRGTEILKIGNELYIMNKDVCTFHYLRPYRRGIKLAQVFSHSQKLAIGAIQLFGKGAEKNTIQLNYAEAMMFVQGQGFLPYNKPINSLNGLVLAKYKQFPIGIGSYKEDKLKSLIPRSQVIRIGSRKRKFRHRKK